jgi:import receptor subunit TOM70
MEAVMEDCNKAIELNPIYMKALTRRYKVAERMGRLKNSLEDITAICILEKFENMDSLKHADRILKKYGQYVYCMYSIYLF